MRDALSVSYFGERTGNMKRLLTRFIPACYDWFYRHQCHRCRNYAGSHIAQQPCGSWHWFHLQCSFRSAHDQEHPTFSDSKSS